MNVNANTSICNLYDKQPDLFILNFVGPKLPDLNFVELITLMFKYLWTKYYLTADKHFYKLYFLLLLFH